MLADTCVFSCGFQGFAQAMEGHSTSGQFLESDGQLRFWVFIVDVHKQVYRILLFYVLREHGWSCAMTYISSTCLNKAMRLHLRALRSPVETSLSTSTSYLLLISAIRLSQISP